MAYLEFLSEAAMLEEMWNLYEYETEWAYLAVFSPGSGTIPAEAIIPSIEGIITDDDLQDHLLDLAADVVYGMPFSELNWEQGCEPDIDKVFEVKDNMEYELRLHIMNMVTQFNLSFINNDEQVLNIPIIRVW